MSCSSSGSAPRFASTDGQPSGSAADRGWAEPRSPRSRLRGLDRQLFLRARRGDGTPEWRWQGGRRCGWRRGRRATRLLRLARQPDPRGRTRNGNPSVESQPLTRHDRARRDVRRHRRRAGINPTLAMFDAHDWRADGVSMQRPISRACRWWIPRRAVSRSVDLLSRATARAIGLRPTGMMFRELPLYRSPALPGRPLESRELSLLSRAPRLPTSSTPEESG